MLPAETLDLLANSRTLDAALKHVLATFDKGDKAFAAVTELGSRLAVARK